MQQMHALTDDVSHFKTLKWKHHVQNDVTPIALAPYMESKSAWTHPRPPLAFPTLSCAYPGPWDRHI